MNEFDPARQYPEIKPFQGEKYIPGVPTALLIIGESHYLPKESTLSHNPEQWYSSSSERLTDKEKAWISPTVAITYVLHNQRKDKPHVIFHSGFQKINEFGPNFSDYKEVIKYCAFFNFFLRPAESEGMSIKVSKLDVELANIHFKKKIETLKPRGIIFLSRKATWNCDTREISIPIGRAPHPGCSWWNRRSKNYGGRLGHECIKDGMTDLDWSSTK